MKIAHRTGVRRKCRQEERPGRNDVNRKSKTRVELVETSEIVNQTCLFV